MLFQMILVGGLIEDKGLQISIKTSVNYGPETKMQHSNNQSLN